MSIPKEPRGLMIQLMYLVLTAMLALNITKEVLDAFSTINTSIETSNDGIKEKNDRMYVAFEHIADKNPELAKKRDSLLPLAQQVRAESDKMVQFLEGWKQQIVTKGGGWVNENGVKKVKTMDDIDIPTRMFVEDKNGDKVKIELQNFVNKIITIAGGSNSEVLRKQLPIQIPNKLPVTDMNRSGDWAFGTFHNIPVIAAITLFSKWQSDVRNSEAHMVENLMSLVGEDTYNQDIIKLDGFMAVATPNISYALAGDEITATIAMAAYDKSSKPAISSSTGAVDIKDGVGTIKFRASGTGMQTVRGTITVKGKGEKTETQPWEFKYTVGTAGASLQLDKMNVMYIGVPNPVTISASGYNLNDVTWSMEGANIKSTGPGKYDVFVDKPNYQGVDYVVTATNKAGGRVEVARGKIRVKSIPSPIIRLGKVVGAGMMGTGELKAQPGLAAELENFDFDYRYLVTSYSVLLLQKGSDVAEPARGSGPMFSDNNAVRDLINRARPGDRLIFESIKVKGPGVPERPAKTSLTITVR
ncbi:MAG: gliding motility protein GldM [Sphingobacteriales bacterium]|nr:MAG: gliding motility protein GldM [Sphingobacteriales bacterium]